MTRGNDEGAGTNLTRNLTSSIAVTNTEAPV